jgi:hypothetical protein
MAEKVIGSPAEAAGNTPREFAAPHPEAPTPPAGNTLRHDDGITNPRDGRGPLRPRDDNGVKLPLRPPH